MNAILEFDLTEPPKTSRPKVLHLDISFESKLIPDIEKEGAEIEEIKYYVSYLCDGVGRNQRRELTGQEYNTIVGIVQNNLVKPGEVDNITKP